MRKLTMFSIVLFLFTVTFANALGSKEQKPVKQGEDLVIYAYDSFVSEWGTGPVVIPIFEKKYGVKVTVISAGDAGQVLQKAIMEKAHPKADIILGIDNNLLSRAKKENIFDVYKPENTQRIPKALFFDPDYKVIPYDYGFFSIVYNSEKISSPPRSLRDLLDKKYSKSIILMDPRTSSPGLGFMLWTISAYGENFTNYWKKLKPNILTITDSWDSGYGLFTSGEAPMVLSYTTSPAYHVEYENNKKYKTAVFTGGNYMQIEGMGITHNAPHRKLAELFIEFALSDDFQGAIPLTNWMYPVSQTVKLPKSFDFAPMPSKKLILPSGEIESNLDKWLTQWTDAVSK